MTGAYYVIDAQRFQNKPANIRAHLFTVQEVHKLQELSFPVKEGLWKPKPPVPPGDYRITQEDEDSEFEDDDELGGDGPSGGESDGEDLDGTPLAAGEHPGDSPAVEGEEEPKDYWEQRGCYLVRVHRIPRRTKFSPAHCEEECPFDLESLDLTRLTCTNGQENLEGKQREERDCWCGSKVYDEKPSMHERVGETRFDFLHGEPPKGWYWCNHQLCKKSPSTSYKPTRVLPDVWNAMENEQLRSKCAQEEAEYEKEYQVAKGMRNSACAQQTIFSR